MGIWLTKKLIYLFILLLATVAGYIKWKALTRVYKALAVLLLVTFLFETAAVICAYVFKSTVLVYNIFDPVQQLIITYIFAELLSKKWFNKIIIAGCIIAALMIMISVFFSTVNYINTLSVIIKSTFFIILSLLKFREMLATPHYENIMKEPVFWLCTAVLLFFTVNILFWSALNYLIKVGSRNISGFFYILYFSNLVFYIILWYSFSIIKNKKMFYNVSNG